MGQSRNENILENMLGASNPLYPPQSREEALLMQLLEKISGGGGASSLIDLNDTSILNPTNGQVLKYNSSTSKWENGESSGSAVHYSTDEQVVGTWIDGSTLYERVFDFSTPLEIEANVWATTNISNSNIGTIVNGWGINISGSNWGFLGFATDTGNYIQILNVRNAPISLKTVILRYTKTST